MEHQLEKATHELYAYIILPIPYEEYCLLKLDQMNGRPKAGTVFEFVSPQCTAGYNISHISTLPSMFSPSLSGAVSAASRPRLINAFHICKITLCKTFFYLWHIECLECLWMLNVSFLAFPILPWVTRLCSIYPSDTQ